jgi:hypothetical protein
MGVHAGPGLNHPPLKPPINLDATNIPCDVAGDITQTLSLPERR